MNETHHITTQHNTPNLQVAVDGCIDGPVVHKLEWGRVVGPC